MSNIRTHAHQSSHALPARACEFAMTYRGFCITASDLGMNLVAGNWLNAAATAAGQSFAGSGTGMKQTKQRGLRRRLH